MFVVSVPYGVFNKTNQTTIHLKKKKRMKKKKKKRKKEITYIQRTLICTNFFYINLSHGGRKKNN